MASSALQNVYNTIFRRNYVFLSVVFTSAFAMEMYATSPVNPALCPPRSNSSAAAFDNASNSRQWKDLKQKYMENDDE
ncbi:unnamed protein product [Aureobasidium uvarum]|uniref:Complex III subunit 9 n=1 Tax=Aureobasidium uvarum TaxID=2773716 RepID=A0A9N8PR19_9PEZI|nr:unnamed protein product [Aureobasidium uvarum]